MKWNILALPILAFGSLCNPVTLSAAETEAEPKITLDTPVKAPANSHWMQVRAGIVPAGEAGAPKDRPLIVITMQKHDNVGTHTYHGIESMWSDDGGETWHGPTAHKELDRREGQRLNAGLIEAPVDATPAWHAKSGKLLLTGATFWIDPKQQRDVKGGTSDTFYAAYDAEKHTWSRWDKLEMPDTFEFHYSRAGCTQRVDLPNGDILLPIYYGSENNGIHTAIVARCKFDGETLSYVEHGSELAVDFGRGFSEPSLVQFGKKFYLTLRNDQRGYVTVSQDGLKFPKPVEWKFSDGKPLGSYNTQQHWLTHGDKLYLVYTRKGLDNDEIFRHRAPVVMAEVDPKTLTVIRETERELLPKLQGGFGNFGVCNISDQETWIVAGRRAAKEGEPSVYIAKIHWP